ncbi:MAG TPA: DUF3800 domain-containing protein [Beijerinckiaceae bacterium]|jgi:hypothetical protein
MNFSDYVIYVDESGDHGLASIDPQYPVFVLVFCLVRKSDYRHWIVPRLQEFKFRWFGHDIVSLHERDIRQRAAPFVFLADPDKRRRFLDELTCLIAEAPFTIVSSVIMKEALVRRYVRPDNPYALALLFCMERAWEILSRDGQAGRLTHIVAEARSPRTRDGLGKEDRDLELEFRRITAGLHRLRPSAMPDFDIVFADKKTNSSGLQLADLVARPIGMRFLRPDQPNRAFETIAPKLLWKAFP